VFAHLRRDACRLDSFCPVFSASLKTKDS